MSPVFMSVFIYRRCEDVPCVYVSVHLQEVCGCPCVYVSVHLKEV